MAEAELSTVNRLHKEMEHWVNPKKDAKRSLTATALEAIRRLEEEQEENDRLRSALRRLYHAAEGEVPDHPEVRKHWKAALDNAELVVPELGGERDDDRH